ncbi:hypothetical protein PtrSN002B_010669 [Pyrenophora tritici-repentis]|uniref:FAP multi-domain protein n=2 Tax=Pyrenophora tritici-repentis TaxID=45151 RepID=A0A2W1EIS3_9PLEO|nr:uncharacterized protein PTRG_10762 [Pyrenophora tritici-repentis Pt-1C-BFP]KAA8621443.1 hypothetical protein PtrV1_05944 [Pyrenophora tritici-repentis]EDU43812.1 predicted protein [Pyrenophora tritici-repentis Pt-1C-BFP]KAF7450676.1 hypothetical protein A1F99_052920 [Pyrenophora tritici-repentis]KAF7573302.1 FAP multi-domain protein [Pyrenophora tritici-repentis]KAG9381109.1 hypothetical protein A1F94_008429 [Pyrenophora tritici-repentis]
MRFTTLAATLASASQATALLAGLSAPATIAPGSRFNLTLIASPRAEPRPEVAVSYGWSANNGFEGALGYNVQSMFLGPSLSDTDNNITILAQAPAREDLIPGRPAGPGPDENMFLNIAFFQLGPGNSYPAISSYNVSVMIGEETSEGVLVGSTTPLLVMYA